MLLFLLKRLLLLIPSLLLISLVAFGLNQCSSGDVVQDNGDAIEQADDILLQQQQQEQIYRDFLAKYDLDLPLFYFSLTTQAHPDTLHRIVPLARQQRIRQLLGETGNWSKIERFLQAYDQLHLESLIANQKQPTDTLIELRQLLINLNEADDVNAIAAKLPGIRSIVESTQQPLLQSHFQKLQQATQQLQEQSSRWRLFVPALHWHGTANRYHQWISQLLIGDFGVSKVNGQPATERVRKAVGWTLRINLIAILLAFVIAVPLGVYSAVYQQQAWVRWSNLLLFLLFALPSFWVATMLVKFLTTPEWFFLCPSHGVGEVSSQASWWEAFTIRARHLTLPIFCLTYGNLAVITRQVRRSMLDVWSSDFVRTAIAKGLPKRQVIWRHAFRNSLFPLITLIGNILPAAITGSVIIEIIFSIPGVGSLTINSILQSDWPVVYTILLLIATLTILGLLLADLLYAWADPRTSISHE